MVDEFGKANPSVKNGMLVPMLERTIGKTKMPEGSIVFATTNLGVEGVVICYHHMHAIVLS